MIKYLTGESAFVAWGKPYNSQVSYEGFQLLFNPSQVDFESKGVIALKTLSGSGNLFVY